jgi:formylglycine-generating enzyme required for sulfatase activity
MSRQTWFHLTVFSGLLAVPAMVVPGWTKAPVPSPKTLPQTFTNSVGMKLVRIPPGKFKMGAPKEEQDKAIDYHEMIDKIKDEATVALCRSEGPQHEVQLSAFYLGAYEVTQKQFKDVMGYNPSYFSRDGKGKPGVTYTDWMPAGGMDEVPADTRRFPVENVSWEEAKEFCEKLTAKEKRKLGGKMYRLPTEAEWEYACRGGAPSYEVFHFGNSLSFKQANFDGSHPYGGVEKGDHLGRTCKVGSYEKNRFGLHDMHGNVWEWCSDWYGEDYYGKSPAKDPPGPLKGSHRVLRGGSHDSYGESCRSASRVALKPAYRDGGIGFRVALCPLAK